MDYQITDIEFRPFTGPQNPNVVIFMIGWVSCVFNGVFLNDMRVKKLPNGRIVITYPRYKRGGNSKEYFYFNAVSFEARKALDDAIFTFIREVHHT